MEPYMIVGFMASPQFITSVIREHYGDQLLELMLQFPVTVDIVKRGLEQLYYESDRQEDHDVAQLFMQKMTPRLSGVMLPSI